mmetsp:Transcript_7470/g.13504  ORF Transcript_7470/g.13504 Transcript_7470/m.13504 type:complete len:202 (+) Transcript_7470:56-661(+)|eukprot:CAMPEP_0182442006 /NCGR_PEP_ID=MMETSP1172-20130603/983_1 /TAXON_ID=708627 /ORGANISM="Timspurckia oligopyrenoides, Strain CCMP3278" /LENGTH=201 /DNA_ID=CAMNT_0024636659 /DNA_START=24 /DNA_END=629 /DNA_ORIENTATION=-
MEGGKAMNEGYGVSGAGSSGSVEQQDVLREKFITAANAVTLLYRSSQKEQSDARMNGERDAFIRMSQWAIDKCRQQNENRIELSDLLDFVKTQVRVDENDILVLESNSNGNSSRKHDEVQQEGLDSTVNETVVMMEPRETLSTQEFLPRKRQRLELQVNWDGALSDEFGSIGDEWLRRRRLDTPSSFIDKMKTMDKADGKP